MEKLDLVPLDVPDGTLAEQVCCVLWSAFLDHLIVHAEIIVLVNLPAEVVGTGRILTIEGVKPSVSRGLVEIAETLRYNVKVSDEKSQVVPP